MAKDKKKKNVRKAKKAKVSTESAKPAAAISTADMAKYVDGAPLDRVQYLEAKLILKPEQFSSVHSFLYFGKIVQRTAKKARVGVVEYRQSSLRPQIPE